MLEKIAFFCFLGLILASCSITPKPLTINERYDQAKKDVGQLFTVESETAEQLDFYQALARGMKYNLDYRLKLVNTALQSGQLKVAEFAMFPALNMTASLYTRNNDLSSSGITGNGVETDLSNSTPRTLRSVRVPLTWNILDFAMGYVRAKQQSERVLIAEEESRRQLQQLSQDVLIAYWSAYSAQQLITETREFQSLLTIAKQKLINATHDNVVPKENLLNYQAALLEGNRRLIQLQYKYDKAMSDLKHLLFLPPDQKIVLKPPPSVFLHPQDLGRLDFQKTDAVTLVKHPQLRGQHYQERIAEFGVKTAILQALPGVTLNEGWNYNSNQFLLNNKWVDKSVDIAWNLLNLASLPDSFNTAKLQVKYEQLKLMALTMAALTETRYAFSRYQTLRQEYVIAHKQTENAQEIYKLNRDRQLASLASDQQVILAKLHSLTSQMDEDLLLSDLSVALGELFLSVGEDLLPSEAMSVPLPAATELLRKHFILNNSENFQSFINHAYDKLFSKENPSACYTLQLFGSYDLTTVKNLQNDLKEQPNIVSGKTTRNGHEWYVLTYGKYTSSEQAKSNIKELPKQVSSLSPWVRKTEDLTWIS